MKLAADAGRLAALFTTLRVWMLTGSLALAGAGNAAASFSPLPSLCRPAGICASRPATSPSFVIASTGAPDGRMAMVSRQGNISHFEIEAADDFIVTTSVRIDRVTFTGLLPSGASLSSIQEIRLDMARTFPLDSPSPPSGHVPTRVGGPSDSDILTRALSTGDLTYTATVLSASFDAANSVVNGINPVPNQTTGGEGPVNGEEVQFDVTLTNPIMLAADHYFLVPKLILSSGNFLWLSAAGPSVFTGDLQAWIRTATLDPDWLRVGTDIVGGATPPKFNASFSLSGARVLFLPAINR